MPRSISVDRGGSSCVSLHEPLEKAEDRYLALGVSSLGGRVAGRRILSCARGDTGGAWDQCGQATKGMWGMSWRQEAMKGVAGCDKPGGVVKRALIPGFPNHRTLNP
jgi:hypothetical protein